MAADENVTTMTQPTPTKEEIEAHLPLVHGIVAQFMRKLPPSVQREDLTAAGTVGLFQALRSSSHTCPEMFASYARIRIRGSIVDELRRHDWSPRRRRTAEEGRPAPLSIVVGTAAANAPPPEQQERVQIVALDDLPRRKGQVAELAEDAASPLDDVLARREHEALHAAVAALPEREREIVNMRYFQGMPSKAIAKAMGLSEARISQLHARATTRLRELLESGAAAAEVKLAA